MLTENEIIKLLKKSRYIKYVNDGYYSAEYIDITLGGNVFIKNCDIRVGSIDRNILDTIIESKNNEKRDREIKKLKSILKGK